MQGLLKGISRHADGDDAGGIGPKLARWPHRKRQTLGPVVEQLRAEGHTIDDTILSLTTPLLRKHINPFGKYHFDLERMRQTADPSPGETALSP